MKTNILDNIFEKHGRDNVLKVVADKWISDNLASKKMSKTNFEHTKQPSEAIADKIMGSV